MQRKRSHGFLVGGVVATVAAAAIATVTALGGLQSYLLPARPPWRLDPK